MRRGRIPDDIYEQIQTDSRFAFSYCDQCDKEVKTRVEHPFKEDIFICQECEADALFEQANLDLDDVDEHEK